MGLLGLGYADSLIIMDIRELHRRLILLADLPYKTVAAIVTDLTYGARGLHSPDLALQPLLRLHPKKYAIAPNIILNSSLERNFAVLMNRLPEERAIYSSFSGERENLSRSRIENAISPLSIRHWHGNVPGWTQASDVDLALMEDSSRSCLILELKSFVAPADIREIRDRSQEIAEGISQIRKRQKFATSHANGLYSVLRIDSNWRIGWAVASESSVGNVFVQDENVPVVRTGDLIRKILSDGSLSGIGEWLRTRAYLPVEGEHYEV